MQLRGARRILFLGELLVFALPCYLIYVLCVPLALLGLWVFCEMLLDFSVRPEAIVDIKGFVPYLIASAAAIVGTPALWTFTRLLARIFRGSIDRATARTMLSRALMLAAAPILVLSLLMIWVGWPSRGTDWSQGMVLDAIFETYVSGLPLLIPAFHLRTLLAKA